MRCEHTMLFSTVGEMLVSHCLGNSSRQSSFHLLPVLETAVGSLAKRTSLCANAFDIKHDGLTSIELRRRLVYVTEYLHQWPPLICRN